MRPVRNRVSSGVRLKFLLTNQNDKYSSQCEAYSDGLLNIGCQVLVASLITVTSQTTNWGRVISFWKGVSA